MMSERRIRIRLGGMIWQREESQRDYGRADDPGGRAHQHAHADDAQRHTALQPARKMANDVEQVVGEA
jgi:hypothetical protein